MREGGTSTRHGWRCLFFALLATTQAADEPSVRSRRAVVNGLLKRFASFRSLDEALLADFTGAERRTLRWCWLRQPSRRGRLLCRTLLLFLRGAARDEELAPNGCRAWAMLGLPDASFVRNELLGRFREGWLPSAFWPQLCETGGVFFDVGSHAKGVFARRNLLGYRPERLHLFEPLPAHFRELEQAWKRRYRNASAHCYGLGARGGRGALTVASGSSSLYQQLHFSPRRSYLDSFGDGAWRPQRARQEVEVRGAAAVWRELGVGELELLNMNCEGCEYSALPALAASGRLKRARNLLLQLHTVLSDEEARRGCDGQTGTCGREAAIAAARRYCNLTGLLERTHQRVFGLPFHAYELWRRREP